MIGAGAPPVMRRLRLAGLLVALGLLTEAATLIWAHPTAFLVFLGVGALLVAVGILVYLAAVLAASSPPPSG